MKTLSFTAASLALLGGLTTAAMAADRGLATDELSSLLDSANQHGFTHFEEISLDDSRHLELEGWREDGWQLEVDMALEDGSLIREQRRKSETPDWGLTRDEVDQALASAREEGLQRFEQLDVDMGGTIEIEGYDAQNREIELYLDGTDFSVTGVDDD